LLTRHEHSSESPPSSLLLTYLLSSAPHVAWEVLWVFLFAFVGTRVFNCSIKQKCGPKMLCRITGVIVGPAGKVEPKLALTLFKGFSNCNCKGIWSEREGAFNECKRPNERLRQRTRRKHIVRKEIL